MKAQMKAQITIIDKIHNRTTNTEYTFKAIMRYDDLYNNLNSLLVKEGYDKKKSIYHKNEVMFIFEYLGDKRIVDNWRKYILNNDVIEILIRTPPIIYSLHDGVTKCLIASSRNVKDLYTYYNLYIKNKFNCHILLRDNNHLIDVLDTPQNHLNLCINRLVHVYNF